ncbi:MAG: apolipoprotein N-acyltransferase [Deltaproteobacteria bacterium]|nr:apolipoprotein N-acyltransferase [Deltaproteobacteria bacterium]
MSIAAGSGLAMAVTLPLVPVFCESEIGAAGWLEPLALVGLIPLLWILRDVSPRRAFGLGTWAGGFYFLLALYWLDVAMTTFGHMPRLLSFPVLFLLVGFLALFWGFAFWAAVRIKQRLGIGLHLSLPPIWVALEFLRNYVLTGFPWAGLGTSQVRTLWLAQLASLAGVYLVCFVVVYSNVALEVLLAWYKGRAPLARYTLAAWAAMLAFSGIYSAVRLQGDLVGEKAKMIKVALIQGNLDEKARLRGAAAQRWVFGRMLSQSQMAMQQGAQLVVWPEGTLPDSFSPKINSFLQLARSANALQPLEIPMTGELIIGGITRGYKDSKGFLTNSAFLVDANLKVKTRYDKRHLVPFGEYVPMASVLPYRWFVPDWVAFFVPGPDHQPLEAAVGKLGILICYEAIFPEIAAETVEAGAELLVNITNDSWYGKSSAPYQHLAISRLRAIETGRYLIRAANTGVSAIIDPVGRELSRIPLGLADSDADRINIRQLTPPARLVGTVALLNGTTVYGLIGDLFAWLCVLVSLGMLTLTFIKKKSVEQEPDST